MSLTRSRGLALAVLCAGMLMIILDGSIVTVALPDIQRDLGFSPATLTWTVNAYMIAFGGLLLLAGRLGDLIGRKRMFVAGLVVFTAASLLCGTAGSPEALIAARFVQGAGGAMASSVSLGMIVTLFPEPRERGRAIGAFAFTGSVGASIGQVLGGVLTDAFGWHWVFFVNLPFGVIAGLLAVYVLDGDRGLGFRAGADALGALLVTAGVMLLVYAVVQAEPYGWVSRGTLIPLVLGVVLLAGFVARVATAARPLLPLRVFRSRNVWGANVVQMLMVAALFGFQVLIALYMQEVLAYDATATGLAMLPAAVSIGVLSLGFSARLSARFGERAVLLAGLVLVLAGRLLLVRLPVDGVFVTDLLPAMLLTGGFGLALPALTSLGMSGARPEDAGVASGLFNTTQQLGAAFGVAVLSTLAASRTEALTAAGHSAADALTGGFRLAFVVGAALVAVAIVVAVVVVRGPAAVAEPQTAEPVDTTA
ncbi:MFS transporter [Planotetraspora thailandica]|uniref:MFS transporter n=1 Tax=Planotetraspora thailandica TaxID=487172 RepID=A0A8J3UWA2_9ACTN|nr:DHA2 family efflux MFS transporter permease subunit [Planotetraspora thailandica]GII52562.1 MFS transporter [Planotetraspora thailandica]